jgi:hypothetical protein
MLRASNMMALLCLSAGVGACYEPAPPEGAAEGTESSADGSALAESGSTSGADDAGGDPPAAPNGYYVQGNTIFDAADDSVHVFRGIDRPSLEWNPFGEALSASDIQLIADWNANVVRVALNQGYWLEGSVVYESDYRAQVDELIDWIQAAGMDVILDLHWSDRGDFSVVPAQQRMADENSLEFWASVAERYKDDGRILFELYNEPHDVAWSVWLHGGDSGDGFHVAGMQELYDEVRATGAENLVLVGGLDYAYDLSGVPNHRVEGHNIVYVTHPYDFNGKQPTSWEEDWGFLAQSDPLFVTEFGSFDCDPTYSQQLIEYAEERGLSWSAWAWFPGGCNFPSLIVDWSGTPSATGQVIKAALEAN